MKKTAFLMIVILLLTNFLACSEEQKDHAVITDAVTMTVVTEAIETEFESAIEAENYGGYEFKILTSDIKAGNIAYHEVYTEGENGELVNDAVYARNSALEEKYSMKVTGVYTGALDYSSFEKSAVASEQIYDMVMVNQRNALSYSMQGYFHELNGIPHLQFDQPWWQQTYREGVSILNKNYFAVCSGNLASFESVPVLFFNKQMIVDLQMEEPYQKVRDGKWTYDAFYAYCKQIGRDLDGDGKYGEEDMYGLLMNSYAALTFTFGGGFVFTEKDADDIPHYTYSEKFITYYQRLVNELFSSSTVMNGEKASNRTESLKRAFKENRGFFYNEMLTYSNLLRDMDTDFGIVPMPKYDESMEHYSGFYHIGSSSTVAIPITVTELDRTGKLVEDFAFYSQKHVYPAYIENTIKTKASRDDQSAEMVDIALSNITCDIIYSADVTDTLRSVLNSGSDNVVSQLESMKKRQDKKLEGYVEKYSKLQ